MRIANNPKRVRCSALGLPSRKRSVCLLRWGIGLCFLSIFFSPLVHGQEVEGGEIAIGPANGRARSVQLSPEKTWVFMVGILDYENPRQWSNMGPRTDEEADEDLYEAVLALGVPEDQVVMLLEEEATLANIEKSFSELLGKTREGDFLITYFMGHGTLDRDGELSFANYDAPANGRGGLWRVADILPQIERQFLGDDVLMAAGCCYSGTIAEHIKTLKTEKGYACLASCQADLESGMRWTFTESIVAGIRGMPYVDGDRDGHITLSEIRDHSFEEVGIFLEQEIVFATNEHFPESLILRDAQEPGHEDIGQYYEIWVGGKAERKAVWKKAKAFGFEDGMITLSCYDANDYLEYRTFPTDSDDFRLLSRETFPVGTKVEVFTSYHWHRAEIVRVDERTGLHCVTFDLRRDWGEALYLFDDIRPRR